jgi:hypothetical protein
MSECELKIEELQVENQRLGIVAVAPSASLREVVLDSVSRRRRERASAERALYAKRGLNSIAQAADTVKQFVDWVNADKRYAGRIRISMSAVGGKTNER